MMKLLDTIQQPQDLKSLDLSQLNQLAGEIRSELVRTVSANGGHLAPNLGVVELTLAMHSVFDSPRDQFIWDVGHQTYVHKLLTGRQAEFCRLRQKNGISGFPKRRESEHDIFETGHSSTSISAALGLVVGRDLRNENHEVVAIIGDGALTGGEAFEALNHAGHLKKKLIVVLNDNDMSIARNVGALSKYLNKLRSDPAYTRGKEELEYLLKRIPHIGSRVLQAVDRVKDAVKCLLVPGMLFEELGFTYLGPVDGHDLAAVIGILQQAKKVQAPTMVHVVTQKGKGYLPAETNPDQFHGIAPFDIKTGSVLAVGTKKTYTQIFGDALVKMAEKDPRIVAITAAMPQGTGLSQFSKRFPDRFFDVGIAEQHAVTFAAGLAARGFVPVVAIYSTFLQRAYDQIVHDVCLQRLPVVFAVDRAGLVGEDGETHQGVFDISFLRHIPHMTIISPRNENELQNALFTALHHRAPIAIRYPRSKIAGVPIEHSPRVLVHGEAELIRPGKDLALFGVGAMSTACREAADLLQTQAIDAAVVDLRYIKPLDEKLIHCLAASTGRIAVVEEHVVSAGAGSAVCELFSLPSPLLSGNLSLPRSRQRPDILCLGLPDDFIGHGTAEQLRESLGLTPQSIAANIFQRWFAGSGKERQTGFGTQRQA